MNRSYSKIRKVQQVNLLSEQRYLKSKGLLNEGPMEDIEQCFLDAGLNINDFSACRPSNVADKQIDPKACISQIQKKTKDPEIGTKVISVVTCATKKMPDLLNIGIDILKTGSDIFGGIFGQK